MSQPRRAGGAAVPAEGTVSAPSVPSPRAGLPVPVRPEDLGLAVFAGTDAMVAVIGADGRPLVVNPGLVRSSGWSEAELRAVPFWDSWVVPEDRHHAQADLARSLQQVSAFSVEADWQVRDGGHRRVSMQLNPLLGPDGSAYAMCVVGVDVTAQRIREATLREHAETDPLTGLRNRRSLFQSLAVELDEGTGTGCGLLFCDLDGLKRANDRFGHHAGDLLLAETARRLLRVTDGQDVVARFGGDEFVVLVPGTDAVRLEALASRVEVAVSEPVAVPEGLVQVGVSIGTALGLPGSDADEVVRRADGSMYRVKRARRRARPA